MLQVQVQVVAHHVHQILLTSAEVQLRYQQSGQWLMPDMYLLDGLRQAPSSLERTQQLNQ
jgi:hypothetical protein